MRLDGIAAMGDFWRVVREFNPEGIEREATAPVELLLVGEAESGKLTLVKSLAADGCDGQAPSSFKMIDLDHQNGPSLETEQPDLVILVVRVDQELAPVGRRTARLLGGVKAPLVLVFTHADQVHNTRDLRNAAYRAFSFASHLRTVFVDARDPIDVQSNLVPVILESIPGLRTAVARQLPAARAAVAEQIIAETCRVNAQFALAANLPANLPFLGGVAGNVADFFVLTKNQVMMVLRLAAIYGRDVSLTTRVMAEIAPVIGGALLWRTAARMAVGMLPTLLAAAPKMGVAYVGTYVAGRAARYYYDQGHKPTRQLLNAFSVEGARRYRLLLGRRSELPPIQA